MFLQSSGSDSQFLSIFVLVILPFPVSPFVSTVSLPFVDVCNVLDCPSPPLNPSCVKKEGKENVYRAKTIGG